MTARLLRRATSAQPDGTGGVAHRRVDVRIDGGVVTEIGTLTPASGEVVVDLDGHLLLPAAVEPHAHLDKAFLAERVENLAGDLPGAIDAMRAVAATINTADIVERAERAARLMAANGYVAVRTHVDVTAESGLRNVRALAEVRSRVGEIIDVEVVALGGWPIAGPEGAVHRRLLAAALDEGADLVGGCPHLEGDPGAATDVLLELAAGRGRGVDLHTDETLDGDANGLAILADRVLAGFDQPATASHCVSLGQQPPSRQRSVAAQVAAGGIGVVALPQTNLFLQGRDRSPVPRALTAIAALRSAGVTVAAGGDNLQDPFNPMGRACPFETASLMVLTAHLLPHEAWAMVSTDAAEVLGRAGRGIEPGAPADLLAVPAVTVREAIAFGSHPRIVWRRGRRTDRHR